MGISTWVSRLKARAPWSDEQHHGIFCVHCRARRTVLHVDYAPTGSGRRRLVGKCLVCQGATSTFVPNEHARIF
jgi:hypothetical protein